MASHAQLDSARGTTVGALIAVLLFLLLPAPLLPQASNSAAEKILKIKKLYNAGRWSDVVRAVPQSSVEDADLELYRGLALAQLQRFHQAEQAFAAGHAGHPRDARFLTEMAGIAYREKRFSTAKKELRHALGIDPRDSYANNFLASIYFLEGNLEAALKYWNRAGRPKLSDLVYAPTPKLDPLVLDRAFQFSPGEVWSRQQFVATKSEIQSLDIFPHTYCDLEAQPGGTFKLVWRNSERGNWNDAKLETSVSWLRGLPYQSVYPEFYNLNHEGLNWLSFVRWDDEKRRLSSEIAAPIAENPKQHFRIYFDGRNENWNVTKTLLPPSQSTSYFNLRRAAIGAGVQTIANWRWQWGMDAEYSYRDFRGLIGIPKKARPFFTDTSGLALRSTVQHSLIRFPERRFSLDAVATGEIGKFFANPLGRYGRVEGTLAANWFPQARGEDYGMRTRLRSGGTFGQVPFDDLYMLGFDRDNDLWMRGHNGLANGQKGNAPLGRNFVLSNSDAEKTIYDDGIFLVKAGPFLDTGEIYDSSGFFGSRKWLTDTGLQTTVRLVGRFEFVLGYGKDLRSGNNTFYSAVSR